ncbi:MAG: hypothetical protein AUK47_09385 [Deltaproteobacteria bacterium CG2_30_63_29]|nr:MAG: hypothetical protein AUK47_09385 [Deltaproteobacteria bacterium CG2_30_63_29]PIW01718.1 MAG: hypothetical protein COW42_04030 [Deltaproteobacteria bacterium CG17_big_fil_post_rev_8_21_14_2_50_63_7]PJB40145.1 MAG: hypothetical protein CO108_15635 [Deltaproteobacteria bacterium CG_4_9_14_3_um_filter_63_12]
MCEGVGDADLQWKPYEAGKGGKKQGSLGIASSPKVAPWAEDCSAPEFHHEEHEGDEGENDLFVLFVSFVVK